MRGPALAVLLVMLPCGAAAQVATPAEQVPPEVASLTSQATHLLAAGDARGALEQLRRARALVPPGSWLAAPLDDLIHIAESQAGVKPPSEPFDAASAEDVAEMYVSLVAFGFWTGAWAFAILAGADAQVWVPLSVVMAGAGAFLAYTLDHSGQPLTGGQASAIDFGLQFGTVEALLVMLATNNTSNGKALATVLWAGGAAGGILAGVIATATGATRGSVSLVYTGGFWGGAVAALVAAAGNSSGQTVAAAALFGSVTGIALTAVLASQAKVSRTRVLFVDLGGLSGALAGVGVAALGKVDGPSAAALTAGGAVVGLAVAALLTEGMDRGPDSKSQAFQMAPVILPATPRSPSAAGLALSGNF